LDKIESHKNFNKRAKEKKKLKVEEPNKKYYIYKLEIKG
jgi:hypothetical protein